VTAFWILVGVATAAAVIDWVAVARDHRRLEFLAKPAVLVALTLAAAVLPDSHTDLVARKWWFVAALACCLLGDILLMLPRDLFVPGLVAFLAGHALFIMGLLQPPVPAGTPPFSFSTSGLVAAGLAIAVASAWPVTLIYRSLFHGGHRQLLVPVTVYLSAIATMFVLAANVGVIAATVGAALFVASDTVLALNRFVRPTPHGNVVVHVTYHLAQGLLVLSLIH